MENENKTENTKTPRIYVASLADYNAGRLHGTWIKLNQPREEVWAEVYAMLGESEELIAEDWAIHDYEYFGTLMLSEFEDIDKLVEIAGLMAQHGPVFPELVSHLGGTSNLEEARRYMEENYRGAFDSVTHYAQEFVEECYSELLKSLPDFISYHIDYEGIARDM